MTRLASILASSTGLAAARYGPPAGPPPINSGPYTASAPFTGLRVDYLIGLGSVAERRSRDSVGYGIAAGDDVQYRRAIVPLEAEVADGGTTVCMGARTVADPDYYSRIAASARASNTSSSPAPMPRRNTAIRATRSISVATRWSAASAYGFEARRRRLSPPLPQPTARAITAHHMNGVEDA